MSSTCTLAVGEVETGFAAMNAVTQPQATDRPKLRLVMALIFLIEGGLLAWTGFLNDLGMWSLLLGIPAIAGMLILAKVRLGFTLGLICAWIVQAICVIGLLLGIIGVVQGGGDGWQILIFSLVVFLLGAAQERGVRKSRPRAPHAADVAPVPATASAQEF